MPNPARHPSTPLAAALLACVSFAAAPLQAQASPPSAPSPQGITVHGAGDAAAERARILKEMDVLTRQLDRKQLESDERRRHVEQLANLMLRLAEHEQTARPERLEFHRTPLGRGAPVPPEQARLLEHSRRLMVSEGVPSRWAPSGWVGLNVTAPHTVRLAGGEQFVRFLSYPQVVSVDPSSPADRAGIRRGDTLVAYNGTDVRHEIDMSRLLVPNSRISVRVRRDGRTRDVPVTVAAAPRNVVVRRFDLKFPEPSAEVRVLEPSRAPSVPRATTARGAAGSPAVRTGVAVAPSVAGGSAPFAARFVSNALLGARVETVSDDLRDATGLPRGLLVMEVAQGTPAHAAGLRPGDVIVSAAGRDAESPQSLRLMLQGTPDRALELTVQRRKVKRKATLRW